MLVKAIKFNLTLEGEGIVNFDSNDQKFLWNKISNVEKCRHNNVSFGKGRYYEHIADDSNDVTLNKTPIISADCLRHAMYEEEMGVFMLNVMHDQDLFLEVLAHSVLLQRGYLFAKDVTLKRTSPIKLSYAKAIEYSKLALETFASSQPKVAGEAEKGGTSFFKREVQGKVKYTTSGMIDLGELGFISVSDVHDRLAVHPDDVDKYLSVLQRNLKEDLPLHVAYFNKRHDIFQIPERGIKLPDHVVLALTKDIIRRLASINIHRTTTGWAKCSQVDIQLVNDPFESTAIKTIYNDNGLDLSVLDGINPDIPYELLGKDLEKVAMDRLAKYRDKVLKAQKSDKKAKKVADPSKEDSKETS